MYGERSAQLIDELIAPMIDMNFTIGMHKPFFMNLHNNRLCNI